MRVSKIWIIRNKQGQYLGNKRAFDAKSAIRSFMDGQAVMASQFKGMRQIPFDQLRAEVSEAQ